MDVYDIDKVEHFIPPYDFTIIFPTKQTYTHRMNFLCVQMSSLIETPHKYQNSEKTFSMSFGTNFRI